MAEPVNNLIDLLLNDNIKALKPYESARRLFSGAGNKQQVWLNANESPFANDFTIDAERFNRYPDCQPPAVIDAYAAYAGIQPDQLLVSRGADEGIELLIRAFCTPGKDSVLICPPTYGMYAISAETCDVGIERAALNDDFSLNVDAIKAFKGKVNLVFICSPNNPTGTSVDKNQLLEVIEHFADSAIVVHQCRLLGCAKKNKVGFIVTDKLNVCKFSQSAFKQGFFLIDHGNLLFKCY